MTDPTPLTRAEWGPLDEAVAARTSARRRLRMAVLDRDAVDVAIAVAKDKIEAADRLLAASAHRMTVAQRALYETEVPVDDRLVLRPLVWSGPGVGWTTTDGVGYLRIADAAEAQEALDRAAGLLPGGPA